MRIIVMHTAVMRITAAVLVLALSGACAGTSPATTVAPATTTSTTTNPARTTVSQRESVTAGPPSVDRDGNPMLGGAGPWEVVQVVSGDTLDVRQDTLLAHWGLAQVDAPDGEECHAEESLRWLQDYVRPVSHPYFVVRPAGEVGGPDGRLPVEMVVGDHARVVGDRGSVNVAVVRAGMARWTRLPDDASASDAHNREFAKYLAERVSAAEADARANGRELWGACHTA